MLCTRIMLHSQISSWTLQFSISSSVVHKCMLFLFLRWYLIIPSKDQSRVVWQSPQRQCLPLKPYSPGYGTAYTRQQKLTMWIKNCRCLFIHNHSRNQRPMFYLIMCLLLIFFTWQWWQKSGYGTQEQFHNSGTLTKTDCRVTGSVLATLACSSVPQDLPWENLLPAPPIPWLGWNPIRCSNYHN